MRHEQIWHTCDICGDRIDTSKTQEREMRPLAIRRLVVGIYYGQPKAYSEMCIKCQDKLLQCLDGLQKKTEESQ
jgi:hypothetical protein